MTGRRAPAFRSALLLSCGILLPSPLPHLSVTIWYTLIGLLFALTVLLLRRGSSFAASISTAFLFVLLGFGLHLAAVEELPSIPPEINGRRVVAEGCLLEDPRSAGRSLRFLSEINRMAAKGGPVPLRGVALVRWSPARGDTAPPHLEEGDHLLIEGTLYAPGRARNPGEFDGGEWLRANGINAELTVRGTKSILRDTLRYSIPPLRSAVRSIRRGILAAIDGRVGGEEGAFLKGLLIGERSEIDPETTGAFVRAGVAHVLAVSGSNVAVVLFFLGLLLHPFRRAPVLRSLLLFGGAVLYMLVTGAQPPVARATLMAGVGLAAHLFQERLNGLNLLGVAALLLLAFEPRILFDIGFQLSFLAVLSLIVGTPRTEALLRPLATMGWPWKGLRGVLRVVAVSLAATIGTLPLTAGAFGKVSLIGIAANVVVVPATGISVLLGSITAILDPVWEWGAELTGAANWGILRFTLWFTRWAAHPSLASLSTHWFTAAHGALFFAFLFAGMTIGARTFRVAAPFFLAFLALLPWLPADPRFHPAPGNTRVVVLDVGQGDAIFIEAEGKRMLIDTGPGLFGRESGRETIIPFLDRTGSRRIDALLLTHGHSDHIGGLRSLLEDAEVCSLYATRGLAPLLARECSRSIIPLESGMIFRLGLRTHAYVLAPEREGGGGDSTGNGASVVIKLKAGETSWILAGDAPVESEERMIRRYASFLRSEVLKVGHHGSQTSSSAEFLECVRPRIAIICAGKGNRFAHPAEETLRRFGELGCAVHRTDVEGAVITESDGGTISIVDWAP